MKPGNVHARLARHYPADVLGWVKGAKWTRNRHTPLSAIDVHARPGKPHDPAKVAAIRQTIRAGGKLHPLVLVNTGKGKLKIADGYHRARAAELEGVSHLDALHGKKRQRVGPWSRAMHDAKLNT